MATADHKNHVHTVVRTVMMSISVLIGSYVTYRVCKAKVKMAYYIVALLLLQAASLLVASVLNWIW